MHLRSAEGDHRLPEEDPERGRLIGRAPRTVREILEAAGLSGDGGARLDTRPTVYQRELVLATALMWSASGCNRHERPPHEEEDRFGRPIADPSRTDTKRAEIRRLL